MDFLSEKLVYLITSFGNKASNSINIIGFIKSVATWNFQEDEAGSTSVSVHSGTYCFWCCGNEEGIWKFKPVGRDHKEHQCKEFTDRPWHLGSPIPLATQSDFALEVCKYVFTHIHTFFSTALPATALKYIRAVWDSHGTSLRFCLVLSFG